MVLSDFVKEKRDIAGLTQAELAVKAGVGLRFIRDMEQGKLTLRMDKVNQVLVLFGCELAPVSFYAKLPSGASVDEERGR